MQPPLQPIKRRQGIIGGCIFRPTKRAGVKILVWWAQWRDESGGIQRRSLRTRNRRIALIELGRIIETAEARRMGIPEPSHPAPVIRPGADRNIGEMIAGFAASIRARGRTEEYATNAELQVRLVAEGLSWKTPADIESEAVIRLLSKLPPERYGPTTRRRYLATVKAFSRWLWGRKILPADPLGGLGGLPTAEVAGDIRRVRRAMSEAEIVRLIDAASKSAARVQGLDGSSRAMLYAVALGTGFRASELASLTPRSLDGSTLRLDAASTKNRRAVVQPIRDALADRLREFCRDREPDAPIWPGLWWDRASKMIREDLRAAGIDPGDPRAGAIDFHALRHTFVTLLASDPTIPVKIVQTLARHADINLTLGRYAHARNDDLRKAVERIP